MMYKLHVILTLAVFMLIPIAHSQEEVPVEIVVVGHQPSPPMWKISKGENVLL